MTKASKNLINGLPHIRLRSYKLFKPNEASLVMVRMRELDREFARQTKQLTLMTKKLRRTVTDRLTPPKK